MALTLAACSAGQTLKSGPERVDIEAMAVPWTRAGRTRALAAVVLEVADGRDAVLPALAGLSPPVAELGEAVALLARRFALVNAEQVRLLASIADEIRLPLAEIDALLETVSEGRTTEPGADPIVAVRAQTAALRTVVRDIGDAVLAGGGPVTLELAPLAPGALVVTACRLFRARASERSIRLAGEVQDDLPEVLMDADRMIDVLGRLLDNALRHTPPRGEIIVSASLADDEIALAVADTGDGLRAEALPRLFDRYSRIDSPRERARGGRGLGLAVARAIVLAHGGRLTVTSDGPGHGATFTAWLPVPLV